jgi:hypothetical protein
VFSASSVGRLASTLHLALRNRALALPDDDALISELANLRLKETSPGVVRLDHDGSGHDDRAVALALCVHHLLSNPEPDFIPIPVLLPATSRWRDVSGPDYTTGWLQQ